MELSLFDPGSWLGILGSVGLTLLGYVAQRYVVPFLKVGRRQKYAEFIAAIAEEAIDELRTKYPDKEWLTHLDEAVAIVCEITGISPEIGLRAVNAAAARK